MSALDKFYSLDDNYSDEDTGERSAINRNKNQPATTVEYNAAKNDYNAIIKTKSNATPGTTGSKDKVSARINADGQSSYRQSGNGQTSYRAGAGAPSGPIQPSADQYLSPRAGIQNSINANQTGNKQSPARYIADPVFQTTRGTRNDNLTSQQQLDYDRHLEQELASKYPDRNLNTPDKFIPPSSSIMPNNSNNNQLVKVDNEQYYADPVKQYKYQQQQQKQYQQQLQANNQATNNNYIKQYNDEGSEIDPLRTTDEGNGVISSYEIQKNKNNKIKHHATFSQDDVIAYDKQYAGAGAAATGGGGETDNDSLTGGGVVVGHKKRRASRRKSTLGHLSR